MVCTGYRESLHCTVAVAVSEDDEIGWDLYP